MDEKRFEDILKDKLYSAEYDGDIPQWSEIEKSIPKPKVVPFGRIASIAATVLILLSLGAGFLYDNLMTSVVEEPDSYTEVYKDKTEDANQKQLQDDNEILANSEDSNENDIIDFSKLKVHVQIIDDSELLGAEAYDSEAIAKNNQDAEKNELNQKDNVEQEEKKDQNSGYDEKNVLKNSSNGNATYASNSHNKKRSGKKHENKGSLNLLASNFPVSNGQYDYDQLMSSPTKYGVFSYVKNNAMFNEKVIENPLKSAKYEHDVPISFGLLGSYSINDRWFLETGLLASFHNSKFENELYNLKDGKQVAWFVGIPVSVGYNLFKSGGFSWYAGAGGKVDFNIKMDQTYKIATEDFEIDKRVKRPLFSVNVKTGISYNLMEWLSIFVEPSLSHYINSDRYHLMWTKNDLFLDLKFGLKANF